MAGPWEQYQKASPAQQDSAPVDSSSGAGPWTAYQQQAAPEQTQSGGDDVSAAEQKYALPSGLLGAVISKESSGNPNAVSKKGAFGLGGTMPATAKGMGYDIKELKNNPSLQVDAAANYLSQMIKKHNGNIPEALAAYNWGPGHMEKYKSGEIKNLPAETDNYINDPRFSQWTRPQDQLASSAEQASQPWAQEAPEPTEAENFAQAGKGIAQAAVNLFNVPGEAVNMALDAAGVPQQYQVYQPQLPQSMQPTDPYAKVGAEIGGYLVPGVGTERAALSIAQGAGRLERLGTGIARAANENVVGSIAQQNNPENAQDYATAQAIGTAASLGTGAVGNILGRAVQAIGERTAGRQAASQAERQASQGAAAQVQPVTPTDYTYTPTSPGAVAQATPQTPVSGSQDELSNTAGLINRAASSSPTSAARADLNAVVNPDQNVIESARKLGIDQQLTPGMVSQNPTYRAMEGAIASVPGNKSFEAQRSAVGALANEADRMITDFGGSVDKDFMNSQIKGRYDDLITNMKVKENEIYNHLRETIPTRAAVSTDNTMSTIENIADDVGGLEAMKSLYPQLTKTMNQLDPTTSPTYGRLDAVRQQVGKALGSAMDKGPYSDVSQAQLKRLYSALSDDQGAAANQFGVSDQWNLAKEVSQQRFGVQDASVAALGKNLDSDVVSKLQKSMVSMAQGSGNDFRKVINSLPDEMVRTAVMTAMNKAFTTFAKSPGQQLGVPGFVKWYTGMLRNKRNIQTLNNAIGYEAARRLHNIYNVSAAMNRLISGPAQGGERVYSHTQIKKIMDELDKDGGMLSKIYGIAKKAGVAESITSTIGIPGAGSAGAIASALSAEKTSRIKAADELISSYSFKSNLLDMNRTNKKVAEAAQKRLEKTAKYRAWEMTLSPEEKQRLASRGLLAFILSPSQESSAGE